MTHPDMLAIKELLSALSRPRPTDIEEDHQQAVVPARHTIRLGPILARLRQSDNYEGNFNHVSYDYQGRVFSYFGLLCCSQ